MEAVMNVALAKLNTEGPVGELFASARGRLPGSGVVAEARQAAFDEFTRLGLPYRRIEDWKYTDLRALLRKIAPLAPSPDKAALALASKAVKSQAIRGTQKLVLVDGVFAPQLSDVAALESGIRVHTLRETLENDSNPVRADLLLTKLASGAMISLNAAMATDGVVISVADQAVLKKPIHILHVATNSGTSAFTRSLVQLGNGARATLVESFVAAEGAASYQTHDSVVLSIGNEAELEHVRLVEDAPDAANISTAVVTVGAKARLNTFNLTVGGEVSRYEAAILIAGEGAHVATNGVNLLNGRQHADTTLVMDHVVPHGESREIFRAVVDDSAHSVFQGRIIVRPDAQKTDAKMMTRALLLSDDAEADNKPELEIFADDVTCGHGATTGALDESLLFYLRARGLSEKEAQALLIQAFVGEAIESIANDALREFAITAAQRWLAARG
jgi:Fe-S cluster assembly protein SufD